MVSVPFSVGEDGRLVASSDSHDSLHIGNTKDEESLGVSVLLKESKQIRVN